MAVTTFAGGMAPHCWLDPCFLRASPACFLFPPYPPRPELRKRARNRPTLYVTRCVSVLALLDRRLDTDDHTAETSPGLFQGRRGHRIASGPCHSISAVVSLAECEQHTSCAGRKKSAGKRCWDWEAGSHR